MAGEIAVAIYVSGRPPADSGVSEVVYWLHAGVTSDENLRVIFEVEKATDSRSIFKRLRRIQWHLG